MCVDLCGATCDMPGPKTISSDFDCGRSCRSLLCDPHMKRVMSNNMYEFSKDLPSKQNHSVSCHYSHEANSSLCLLT